MKNFYLSIVILFTATFIFTNKTFSEDIQVNENQANIGVDDGGVPNDPALQANKLNYIDTRFCNNGPEEENLTMDLSLVARPGEEKEICIIHFNRSKEDIFIRGAFPDNAIEPNGNRNCSANYERNNPFSSFIKPFEDNLIKVPAKSSIIRKTTIKFPVGINGLQKGCFAYGLKPNELKEGEMFLFVTRKIAYVNVLVEGDANISSNLKIKNISNTIENDNLNLMFDIENIGSIDEQIDIEGTISNSFGYNESFSIKGINIDMDKNEKITTKDLDKKILIPRYKGPFKVDIKINHKARFDFDISKYGIDPKILEGETITETKSIFIFPTIPVIGLIVFIILIYFAFFRKPKVVYVQQTPSSPNQ